MQDRLFNLKIKADEDSLNYGVGRGGQFGGLALTVGSESDSAPTEAALQRFERLKVEVAQYMERWKEIRQKDLPAVERAAEQKNILPLMVR